MLKYSLPPAFCLADRPRQPAYKPKGVKYPGPVEVFKAIGQPTEQWTYSVPWSNESTWVLRYDKPDGSKKYRVITKYKGGWYIDQMPPVPYPIYRKNHFLEVETVYVFEGEENAGLGCDLGLHSTTSMGGPTEAALSDWSPLEEKHVVIVRDFDAQGLKYAEEVAQLVLAAGAYSAKIVTLPGLSEGQGIQQWVGDRCTKEGKDVLRAEIEAMAAAAPKIERQKPPAKSEPGPAEPQIELKQLSEIAPEKLDWVWANVIPQGALSLITGEPGVGKSLFTLEVAAAVTRGDRGPHDETQGVPAGVILFSGQDDLAKTIRPRLEAAGANVSLIYALSSRVRPVNGDSAKTSEPSSIADSHLSILDSELQRLQGEGIRVRLAVIDPMIAFAGPDFQNADAADIVTRLAELAARRHVAIVIVSDAGSAIVGANVFHGTAIGRAMARTARSTWTIVRDQYEQKRRILFPIKTNLCEEAHTMAYSVRAGAIQWEPETTHISELERATEWVKEQLSCGPVFTKVLEQDAKDNDITPITLRRARARLNALSRKDKATGRNLWVLPTPEPIAVT